MQEMTSTNSVERRWRWLQRARLIADRLVPNLESDDGYGALLVFCTAHPATYLGVALSTSADFRTPLDLTQRLPAATLTDRHTTATGGRNRGWTVTSTVRVERGGVRLNMAHKTEPAAAATAQLQLVALLVASAGFPFDVAVECADTAESVQLLLSWERSEPRLSFTVATLRLRGSAVLSDCVRANGGRPLHHALGAVVSLTVTPSTRTADNMLLKELGTLKDLRALVTLALPLQSLPGVSTLTALRSLTLSAAAIGDADVRAIAALPALEELALLDCPEVSTVNALGSALNLTTLSADGCKHLFRVANAPNAPRLRTLSFCGDPYLKENEVAKLLLAATRVENLSLVHQYLPSTPPPSSASLWLCPALRVLNLSHANIRGAAAWLTRMPHLQQLHLSQSTVTDGDLNVMFPALPADTYDSSFQVEVLTLVNCDLLFSQLHFALRLPALAKLSISSRSVAPESCIHVLRQNGKDIDVY